MERCSNICFWTYFFQFSNNLHKSNKLLNVFNMVRVFFKNSFVQFVRRLRALPNQFPASHLWSHRRSTSSRPPRTHGDTVVVPPKPINTIRSVGSVAAPPTKSIDMGYTCPLIERWVVVRQLPWPKIVAGAYPKSVLGGTHNKLTEPLTRMQ